MVAVNFEYEVPISVPAKRVFKALILDGNVVPKVLPKGVKSIEILEEGGATIQLLTLKEGRFKSRKERIDGVDRDNLTYTFTTLGAEVEGGSPNPLSEVIESLLNVVKAVPSGDGGSIIKITNTYYTKGNAQVTEEQVKGKERYTALFKGIEEWLLTNPDLYN